jgi:hypothetical protein
MSKVNEIKININRAIITKVWIELGDMDEEQKVPHFTVFGWLLSDTGRKVSEFTFWSNMYNPDAKIEIPLELHPHAGEIFRILQPVISKKFNNLYKALPAPKKKK